MFVLVILDIASYLCDSTILGLHDPQWVSKVYTEMRKSGCISQACHYFDNIQNTKKAMGDLEYSLNATWFADGVNFEEQYRAQEWMIHYEECAGVPIDENFVSTLKEALEIS